MTTAEQAPGADEKKGESVKVTVKSWDSQGKKFLNPVEVDARRTEVGGVVRFYIPAKQAVGRGEPTKGSEITEADGTVRLVTRTSSGINTGEYLAVTEKKAVEKKP